MTNTQPQKNQTMFLATESLRNLHHRLHYRLTKQPLPFPTIFQIQTNTLCNGACIMCPRSQEKNTTPETMTDALFHKIITEINENQTKDTFLWLHLQNEPLTDPTIFQKIRHIKKISNGTLHVGLVSNGTLLTTETINELNTSGLDKICFSIDAATEHTYQTIRQGLNYHTVLQNIQHLQHSNTPVKIYVRFIWQQQNYHELNEFKKQWKNQSIPTEIGIVNNRAGTLTYYENIKLSPKNIPLRYQFIQNLWLLLTKGCYQLATTFNILSNGDVIMCCNDYTKHTILGNLQHTSIKDIWTNNQYQTLREGLFKKQLQKNSECQHCSIIQYSWKG
jgi:radical SAM protein with 4Fe4S-binding SPASM domain